MTTVRIDRPKNQAIGTDSKPFWPAGRTWLDVTIVDGGGKITATGIDDQNDVAFTAELLAGQEARFLEAVRAGNAADEITAPSNDNQAQNTGADANTVIVTDPGPGGDDGSKKYRVELPLALQAAKRPTGT
jgi:N-acetylmuramoyl-L-alanine amidase